MSEILPFRFFSFAPIRCSGLKRLCQLLPAVLIYSVLLPVLSASPPPVRLVTEGNANATLVLAADAPPYTVKAAMELVDYIGRISGARPAITHDPSGIQGARIWVGHHPMLVERFPQQDFSTVKPEEFLLRTYGGDLFIIGNDEVSDDGAQRQTGTLHAVNALLRDELGVRWLWPGPLGTDVPQQKTIEVGPLDRRYHPQLRYRQIRASNFLRLWGNHRRNLPEGIQWLADIPGWAENRDQEVRSWYHRYGIDHAPTGGSRSPVGGSLNFSGGHAFSDWYDRFAKDHPEWFALQPCGLRVSEMEDPYPVARNVKLCISNPGVAQQWLADAANRIESSNRTTMVISASPNDNGWDGYCVCEDCIAWDNPDAPILERPLRWRDLQEEHYALSDRYARFWNILAGELKQRYPDRNINVGTWAYHAYRPAPTEVILEDNVFVGFVGVFRRSPVNSSETELAEQRELWRDWSDAVSMLLWRPNLTISRYIHGLPYVPLARFAENMSFMADHKLAGVDLTSVSHHWATKGPFYYLMAQLVWDPYQDAEALMQDYYQRAYGPAADFIARYFRVFEQAYNDFADQNDNWHRYNDVPRIFGRGSADTVDGQAAVYLAQAEAAVADGNPVYRDRVAMVRTGFEFIQAQLDSMEAMNEVRRGAGADAVGRANKAADMRQWILENEFPDGWGLNYLDLLSDLRSRPEQFGPVSN